MEYDCVGNAYISCFELVTLVLIRTNLGVCSAHHNCHCKPEQQRGFGIMTASVQTSRVQDCKFRNVTHTVQKQEPSLLASKQALSRLTTVAP